MNVIFKQILIVTGFMLLFTACDSSDDDTNTNDNSGDSGTIVSVSNTIAASIEYDIESAHTDPWQYLHDTYEDEGSYSYSDTNGYYTVTYLVEDLGNSDYRHTATFTWNGYTSDETTINSGTSVATKSRGYYTTGSYGYIDTISYKGSLEITFYGSDLQGEDYDFDIDVQTIYDSKTNEYTYSGTYSIDGTEYSYGDDD